MPNAPVTVPKANVAVENINTCHTFIFMFKNCPIALTTSSASGILRRIGYQLKPGQKALI